MSCDNYLTEIREHANVIINYEIYILKSQYISGERKINNMHFNVSERLAKTVIHD